MYRVIIIYILVIIDFLTAFLLIIIMKSRRAFGVLFHYFLLEKSILKLVFTISKSTQNALAYSIISNRIETP
jgi:hypothetical protein